MKIYHLKQQHNLPFGIQATPEYKNNTVRSQMLLADFIKSHPGLPVLTEGLYEDQKFDESCSMMSSAMKTVFPEGIPDKFEDLTELQKDVLYDYGAARVLFFLQTIPAIYKSIHKDECEKIDREIEAGHYSLIFHARETEAISCVIEAARGTGQEGVILIFGGAHDFGEKCKAGGIELDEVDCRVLATAPASPPFPTTDPDPATTTHSAGDTTGSHISDPVMHSAAGTSLSAPHSTIDRLNARLSEYPGDIEARLERARILEARGLMAEALQDYKYVNEQYPANPVARDALQRLDKVETAADSTTTTSPRPGV
jgi:hypothetical protein